MCIPGKMRRLNLCKADLVVYGKNRNSFLTPPPVPLLPFLLQKRKINKFVESIYIWSPKASVSDLDLPLRLPTFIPFLQLKDVSLLFSSHFVSLTEPWPFSLSILLNHACTRFIYVIDTFEGGNRLATLRLYVDFKFCFLVNITFSDFGLSS